MLRHVGAWRAVSSELAKAVVEWHTLPRFRRKCVSSRHSPVAVHRMVCYCNEILALNTKQCTVYVFRADLTLVRQWNCYASHREDVWDLAVSQDGRVFLLANDGHICVFRVDGTFVCDWQVDWDGTTQLDCIAVHRTRAFVTWDRGNAVHVLDLDGAGSVLRSWKMNVRTSCLCVTDLGLVVFVTDSWARAEIRIQVRDEWGVLLHSWLVGQCATLYPRPMHVALRGSHIFLSLADFHCIVEYHITGTKLSVWDGEQSDYAITGTREGHLILANSRHMYVYA